MPNDGGSSSRIQYESFDSRIETSFSLRKSTLEVRADRKTMVFSIAVHVNGIVRTILEGRAVRFKAENLSVTGGKLERVQRNELHINVPGNFTAAQRDAIRTWVMDELPL